MAVRVTAAHTAEARAEAGREAGEGGVAAAAAALAPGGFLGLPAPFSEEGNRAARGWARPGWGRLSLAGGGPDGLSCGRDTSSRTSFLADLVGLRGTPQSFPRALWFSQALGPHPMGRRSPPAWAPAPTADTHWCPNHTGCPWRLWQSAPPPAGPALSLRLDRALPSAAPPPTSPDRPPGPWPGCG